ncbi:GlcG/HbpS family heme-binding protein [Agrobacterium tumefaciens]|uniref:GlcG/HbpS family heme-binding protein n=1 Tax=Agrobacterium tumefaciens TaxID=358 RepID=UPI0015776126|nr:heme-binding protein [Agrobacterium tumefaciens]NTZ89655.1 heme-binding protein [Agrobacterium tumefaciens]
MIRNLLIASVLLAPAAALAQTLPTAPYLPLEMAEKAAKAALQACVAKGSAVTVAIVTRDGATKTVLKADNSGPHTVSSATGKAFAAASLGRDIGEIADFIASKPANDGLRNMDERMVIQAGGLPIKIGDALVGGIGVGGAPSGAIDAECAREGLNAIGAK